jgi:hypothetical protein
MKRKRVEFDSFKIISILLSLSLVLLLVYDIANSGDDQDTLFNQISGFVTFSMNPIPSTVNQGDSVRFDVTVTDAVDLAGVQMAVAFNPAVLIFDRIEEGTFLNSGGASTLNLGTEDTSQPGLVSDIVFVRIGSGIDGNGLIASIYFAAINAGTSDIDFQEILLSDSLGQEITNPLLLNGTIIVNSGPGDTTPPGRSNGQPTTPRSPGTIATTISLSTNESANCSYSTTASTAYSSMTNDFNTSNGRDHWALVSGLQDGQSYSYYIRCIDQAGNANPDDFLISFSVGQIVMCTSIGGDICAVGEICEGTNLTSAQDTTR